MQNLGVEPPEAELKRLLLSEELNLLDEVRQRCAQIETRIGDDPALQKTLRGVIVDVLREAGINEHERLAAVLSPLILAGIRKEIRDSRDLMVDALYPITGRLVTAAVRNAFRELMDNLNEKLDESFSLQRWKARIQARVTGKSEAEILLSGASPFRIDELLVLHKRTGLLIAHAKRGISQMAGEEDSGNTGEAGGVDGDLVGGMLTAIMSFTKDAFGGNEDSELRTLAFGESELFLRSSPAIILAVRATGTPPKGFEGALESLFQGFLEQWGEVLAGFDGELEEQNKNSLTRNLQEEFQNLLKSGKKNFATGSNKGYAVLTAIALLLILWGGSWFLDARKVEKIEESAFRVISGNKNLTGYPMVPHYDLNSEVLKIEGLAPDAKSLEGMKQSLAASLPEVAVEYRVGILPTEALKRLGENEAQLRAEVSRAIGNIETRINALGGRFDDSMGKIEGLGQRLGDVEAAGPTPLERLQGWTQRHYVLFGEGSNFRFPKQTDRDLREAAELFKTTPADVHVRIIGYTDPTGSTKINNSLSYARANAVLEALASFGVARDRLIAVGRSTEKRLSPLDGEDSLNRRVEFEIFIFGKATNDAL